MKAAERRLCSWEGVLETSMDLLGDEEGEACGGMWGATGLPRGGGGGALAVSAHLAHALSGG